MLCVTSSPPEGFAELLGGIIPETFMSNGVCREVFLVSRRVFVYLGLQEVEGMNKVRWSRIVIFGFLSELAVFAVFIPSTMLLGERPGMYTAVIGSFVMPFLFGRWAARKVKSKFALHGLLVGAVGVIIYLGLTRLQPEPALYIFGHALKLLGGGLGGYVARPQRFPA
jgi:putative membrane protein (TIGR04086 family)